MALALIVVALALLGSASSQNGYGYGAPASPFAPSNSYGAPDIRAAGSELIEVVEGDPIAALAANIPGGGVPGEDYPILASVPDTGFSCGDVEFPGYYADTADEAGCQAFHICQEGGRQDSFLCPNGTVFQQQYFVCNWWFNVDCAASTEFYGLNAQIGEVPDVDALASNRNEVIAPNNLYGVPEEPVAQPSNVYGTPARF